MNITKIVMETLLQNINVTIVKLRSSYLFVAKGLKTELI